jgi:DtxR family Mn-dependent transcriptional regulator
MASNELLRSQAVEDYAKAIYSLQSRSEEPVSTNALAERLGITPGSVSAMLGKLDELGLATHVPYRGVRLTADGRRLALEVIRHHRLLESFLANALGMPWDRVHAEAEVLEHVLSEDLEQLIAAKLGNPTVDPHGDPIPSADLELEERPTRSMESLQEGEEGVFVRVSDADPEMLRYLAGRPLRGPRAPALRRPAVRALRRAGARDWRPARRRDASGGQPDAHGARGGNRQGAGRWPRLKPPPPPACSCRR